MKIHDVMTHSVETVDHDATLRQAAQYMDDLDVGSLPVARRGQPVGIVTDRDITVRAVAQGLDPASATVGDIMTTDLSFCRDTDDLEDAAALMQDRQVRRLLVLDAAGRLCGIVSLGDLSIRSANDILSEGVLEEVSAPTHPYRQHASPRRRAFASARWRDDAADGAAGDAAGALIGMAAGAAGGAAIMYLFDPQRGRRRRALLRDQVTHASRRAAVNARKTAQYTSDRTRGLFAETAAHFRHDHPADVVLTERVRAALGRAVSHPGSIRVSAHDGVVTLRGPVLADEADHLLKAVEHVRGVHKVEDQLDLFEARENIPGLQGPGRRPGQRHELAHEHWSPTMRLLTGVGGATLATWGLARRDLLGAAAGLVGAAVATRSLTNLPAARLTGVTAGRRAIDVHKTIHISAPLEAVFDFWSNYENFPRAMTNVREVQDRGDGLSHWVVAGPAGKTVEWDAELTQFIPGELIAWKSTEDSAIQSAGAVRFKPDRAGGTRVDVQLSYNPPAGAIGHALAKAFGADPKSEMDQDLMRMKTVIETGLPPHDAARKGEAAPVNL